MTDNPVLKKVFFFVVFFSLAFSASLAFASETNGTIDPVYKYAWGENIGWLNFGCITGCDVQVTDSGLSGYAWDRQYGWIHLNPPISGVKNTEEGVLSGYAWGSNIGWINFTGVTINSSGEFIGYATVKSDNSKINFNCAGTINSCSSADFKVKTDWRPRSVRHTPGGSSGGSVPHNPPPVVPPATPPTIPPTPPPVTPPILPPAITEPVISVVSNVFNFFNSFSNFLLSWLLPPSPPVNVAIQIPKIAPFSLSSVWNLLPEKTINSFVFAPLPPEILALADKFPELSNTLKSVGVERLSDVGKLTGVTLNIPGLAEQLSNTIRNVGVENLDNINNINGVGLNVPGLSNANQNIPTGVNVGTGNIALVPGLPVSNFTMADKKNLPSEFVFARTAGELVDLNVALSISDQGQVTQQISTLPGKTMKLVIKPISSARSITGYFVFQAATPRITQNSILRESLTASALFSMNDLVESNPVPVEQKLVLSSFEYTDPDHDGIYTADVVSPSVAGEYQIITVIDYVDPTLGIRQIRMTDVIDPEGYVFEKDGIKETRIPSAIVSLYYLNTATKQYELWPAKNFQQENPQITDIRGTYSFLVPEGSYYFQVDAPGYAPYQGKVFVATAGGGIHQNIELKSMEGFFSNFDWKTALLIVVFLLLVYNLYRNTLRDRLSKVLNKNDGK